MSNLTEFLEQFSLVLKEYSFLGTAIALLILLLIVALSHYLFRKKLLQFLRTFAAKSSYTWDDALVDKNVFSRLVKLVPATVFLLGIQWLPGIPTGVITFIEKGANAYLLLLIMLAIGAFISAVNSIYEQYPLSRDRPIKGYIQIAKIIVYAIGSVLIISDLLDKSPLIFLSSLGALTAVLMLVFKDTLLSLVASVQLIANDMVRVGDWIEMPSSAADGEIIDVALHTVKVQNWDKTITTIPTSRLIASSFKNWRGMSESGGRRIKRSLFIDLNSIRFLSPAEVDASMRFHCLETYILQKKSALKSSNQCLLKEGSDNVNLRRLTNIGTFRAYIIAYLKSRADINNKLTFLVRQRPPASNGIPLELYFFTKTTNWSEYENIQADIFDHLLAMAAEFQLRIYQAPSGHDLTIFASSNRKTEEAS